MEDAKTQGFPLNRQPTLPFATVDLFLGLVRAGTTPHKLLPFLIPQLGFPGALRYAPKLAEGVG